MSNLKFCYASRPAILDASSAYLERFLLHPPFPPFLLFPIFVFHLPSDLVLQATCSPAWIEGERYSPRALALPVRPNLP